MTGESSKLIAEAKDSMNQAIAFLEKELIKIRAGKVHPSIFDNIKIEYYGKPTPLPQLGNINIPDARTIVIQPWDRTILKEIEKAILNANLGFTPVNNGEVIRISVPPLTEERRKELSKKVKTEGEEAKIAIRNIRRSILEKVKKLTKDGVPEDETKQVEKEIQQITDKSIAKIDEIIAAKEKEIMSV
ncbi:MAG: ribosome recycling factor [Bacteroidales bacterium]|nr:ribosome recycling factor [Bacteroidales bacterium]